MRYKEKQQNKIKTVITTKSKKKYIINKLYLISKISLYFNTEV